MTSSRFFTVFVDTCRAIVVLAMIAFALLVLSEAAGWHVVPLAE